MKGLSKTGSDAFHVVCIFTLYGSFLVEAFLFQCVLVLDASFRFVNSVI